MIQQGLVEKVIVPNMQKKTSVASVKCLRLLDDNSTSLLEEEAHIVLDHHDDNFDDDEIGKTIVLISRETSICLG